MSRVISPLDPSGETRVMISRHVEAVFFNGNVITLDPSRPKARAIAVSDGRIVAVGDNESVKRQAPRGCDRHDLGGKTVVPGFIDCHTHFIGMGVDSMGVDLSRTKSLDEAIEQMRLGAKRTSEGQWVIGAGWSETRWQDGRFITRNDLDECCPKHPAVAYRVCRHLSSVNSLAISELGIGPKTHDVELDASGGLTGILRESAVSIARAATAPDKSKRLKGLQMATRKAHSLGVTSINDNGDSEDLGVFREAEKNGKLAVRVWFNTPSDNIDSVIDIHLSTGFGSNWLMFGGLKVFCDGALGARSAAVSESYLDDPGNKGMFVHRTKDFEDIVMRSNEAGVQLVIHAIGDAGIGATVSAIEKALRKNPRKDHRHRIEHLELPLPAHLKSMRSLGIVASMQPNFVGEWGGVNGLYYSRLGRERAARNNPFKEVLDARVRLAFGSDCMPMSPIYGIHSAVNAHHGAQHISVESALAAYTREAAYASFSEGSKGTISEGKLADFVVLSVNPFAQPDCVSAISVMRTVVGGEIVFDRPSGKRTRLESDEHPSA